MYTGGRVRHPEKFLLIISPVLFLALSYFGAGLCSFLRGYFISWPTLSYRVRRPQGRNARYGLRLNFFFRPTCQPLVLIFLFAVSCFLALQDFSFFKFFHVLSRRRRSHHPFPRLTRVSCRGFLLFAGSHTKQRPKPPTHHQNIPARG